jgi:hypothetical protein
MVSGYAQDPRMSLPTEILPENLIPTKQEKYTFISEVIQHTANTSEPILTPLIPEKDLNASIDCITAQLLVSYAVASKPTLVATRPLAELKMHLKNRQRPSVRLLARCVQVIALALFRRHFYDNLLLLRPEALIHSLNRRVQVIYNTGRQDLHLYFTKNDLAQFDKQFPYLLQSSHYYRVKGDPHGSLKASHPSKCIELVKNTKVKVPDFSGYKKIQASSIIEYFEGFHHLHLTDRKTISGILKSKYVSKMQTTMDKLSYFQKIPQ